MPYLNKAGQILDKLARWLVQITVAVMAITVTFQVIWRYFLKNPIIWAEELARYGLVWMTFIGAAVALKTGQLACVDLLVSKLPHRWQKGISFIVTIVNSLLLAFLLYYSIQMVNLPSVTNQKSPALRLPMNYVYLGIPLGMGLMLIQSLLQLVNSISGNEVDK
ncbi:TRAP transporter small permease [Neomoorella humiferrea]|uniref:TRAP transporter small permease n=1 Tax=Neomoorella humiferrea TaxID=676965 RepID=UPI003D8AC517